jgi:hypothetical protein
MTSTASKGWNSNNEVASLSQSNIALCSNLLNAVDFSSLSPPPPFLLSLSLALMVVEVEVVVVVFGYWSSGFSISTFELIISSS